MSYVMTYDSLVEDIKAYTDRTDTEFTTQIPRIVAMAENRIAREVKVLGLMKYVSSSFTAGNGTYEGNGVVAKPARWRETVYWNYGSGTSNNTRNELFCRTYDFCRDYWPDPTSTGTPLYYCDYGYDHWLVVPTPASTSPFEIGYWEMLVPLDAVNQTNWLTANAPDLILYACLLESAPFLKRMDMVQGWQMAYAQAAKALGQEDINRALDNSANKGT